MTSNQDEFKGGDNVSHMTFWAQMDKIKKRNRKKDELEMGASYLSSVYFLFA